MAERRIYYPETIEDVRQFALLTPAGEIDLAQKRDLGDRESWSRLVCANLRLVMKVASYYAAFASAGLDTEDLISEGNTGLMRFAEKFKPDLGYRFTTGATWWIIKAITRAYQDQGSAVRIPAYFVEDIMRVEGKIKRMQARQGVSPSTFELTAMLKEVGINSPDGLSHALFTFGTGMRDPLSLDKPRVRTQTVSCNQPPAYYFLKDVLIDPGTDVAGEVEQRVLAGQLYQEVDSILDKRAAVMLKMRFGLGSQPNWDRTLEEVGKEFGLTRERVRQVTEKSLQKLRASSVIKAIWGKEAEREGQEETFDDFLPKIRLDEHNKKDVFDFGLSLTTLKKLVARTKSDKKIWGEVLPTIKAMLDQLTSSDSNSAAQAAEQDTDAREQLAEGLIQIWNRLRGAKNVVIPKDQALPILRRIESVRFLSITGLSNKVIAKTLDTDSITVAIIKASLDNLDKPDPPALISES